MKKEHITLDDLFNNKKEREEREDKIINTLLELYKEKKRLEELKHDIEYCFTRFY